MDNKKAQHSFTTPFFYVTLLFAIISVLNIPILETLWRHSFDDGTYSHAFLIPFIVLYLYFQLAKSGKLQFREKISIFPIILITVSSLLLLFTSNAQISIGYWLSFLALLISSFIFLFNLKWATIFPVSFLIFIFPFWGLLVPFLQNLSVKAVSFIMGFTGIPTFVNAEFITIPAGVFEIAGGCSGLRYFIVSIAISSLFIFMYIKNIKKALVFFSVSILGALLTNWIRITALIVIGDYTNMESSLMEDHNTFGWYIYLPFMLLLFMWGNTLVDTDIFKNDNSSIPLKKASLTMLTIVMLVVTLSSTTIISFLNTTHTAQSHPNKTVGISPVIYFASSVDSHTSNNLKNTYKTYTFDGSELDGKPSYYANSMLPKDHRLLRTETENGWNIIYARTQKNSTAILFRYEINNTTYTNLSEFKIMRLKKAVMNINNTKLHWVYLPCEGNCKNAINTFLMPNN